MIVKLKIPANLSHNGVEFWKDTKIDACIAPLVKALQTGGIDMLASCCGHGKCQGSIWLADGRTLTIMGANDKNHAKQLWRVVETDDDVHVVPVNGDHSLSQRCRCCPTITQYSIPLVVHHEPN